jgi:K+ potassium transporter
LHCWRSRPGSSREADALLQVLHDGDEQEFVGGSGHPAQSQASEAQMTFEMCEAHLDLPAFTGRLFAGPIQHKGTSFIGKLFSPVMFAWFVVIGLLGVVRSPTVLGAINPQ